MKAEIINIEDGGRVVLGKIKPIGNRTFCLEIHRGEPGGFENMHALMTRDELH